MAQQNFAALRAAAVDGRTRNTFFRKEQLQKLHQSLATEASAIQEAIVASSACSPAEAKIEYSLALEEVKHRFVALDTTKELEDEYAIARKANASNLRVGAGIVILQPTSHTLFFSTVAPLSSAIAAGNCVVLQLANTTGTLSGLLRRILKSSLDPDTFAVASSPVQDEALLNGALQVIQEYSKDSPATANQLVSTHSARTVAVVDRSANFDEAAKALISARFAFGGKSPFAPDLVLVNEFVKKDLLQALVRQNVAAGGREFLANGALEKKKKQEGGVRALVEDLQRNQDARLITQEANGAIVEIGKRSANLLQRKLTEPCLVIHSMKSLDDGIDFISSVGPPLAAAYHFGDPETGKYLSQFIPAQVSFVNHIPSELLVGPTFPLNHNVDPSTRYPVSLFSKPAPAFITPVSKQSALIRAALTSAGQAKAKALSELYATALAALPVVKRRKPIRAGFGFFEQAFFLHFGSVIFSTVGVITGSILLLKYTKTFPFRR